MPPMPKRSDQLIRRNKPEVPVTKIEAVGEVKVPRLGIEDAHLLVADFYKSLKNSAQSRWYEESDWQYARFMLYFVDRLLKAKSPSAMMLATVNTMMNSLLVTEGDRRRVRMEIERKPSAQIEDFNTVADLFRQRLTS